MASVGTNELSNEDWLVMRARSCAKTDRYAAKAWMITARTLFPRNFNIQVKLTTAVKKKGEFQKSVND